MKLLPAIAAVVVLAELAGAIAFAAAGSWVVAGLLAAGCVALAVVARGLARSSWGKPPAGPGYVQRDRSFY